MKKIFFIFTVVFCMSGISNAQYFFVSGKTGIAFDFASNNPYSAFGINIIELNAGYSFMPLMGVRFTAADALFFGSTTTNVFGFQTQTSALNVITIKGDFMIGNLEKNSSMQYYGYIGPGIAIPTSGGGPFFNIDFGGGINFKIANNLYITTETGFGLVTSSPVFMYIPIKGGIKYDF